MKKDLFLFRELTTSHYFSTIIQVVKSLLNKKTKKTLAESQSITTFAAESWQSGRLRQS
jgi:hypothetical protein